ncbi:hypothetical protein YTPLAS73_02720 [Nitrosarchaeum sp.]|nr:hypothetical protein YTPLAS73_02720 [Nitrosarchaeum sp.]
MVTQSDTAKLLKIIRNLTYVNINCKLATSNYQLKIAPRNKEGNILHALSEAVNIGNWIFDSDHELHHILNEISRWVQVILLNYRENFLEIGKKYNLDFNDAEKLEFESNKWITEILSFYERSITKMVGEMTLWRTYDELILKIDNESKQELEEALLALLSGLPTASIMLMNRVS